jgi:response regulator RpfG family c-di-GMP phosphodiesterase
MRATMHLSVTTVLADARRRRRESRTGRVLCVDDESRVLEGLRDNLRRTFDVEVAASGAEGLTLLREDPDRFAIVISDLRMPVMPGSVFLREARRVAPNAVRMALTGYADLDSAIRTVNDGQLFRFLTKPCAPEYLLRACIAAMTQHRLVLAERVLLDETLRRSVMALTDVLALTRPAAFGRAARVRSAASRLARLVEMPAPREVELAAMLAQVGAVTLPHATTEKLYAGGALTEPELRMVARLPEITGRILGRIPRLEGVLVILANVARPFGSASDREPLPLGARVLRIVFDYDELESSGAPVDVALATMRARRAVYDPCVLEAFADSLGPAASIREVGAGALRVGMTLAGDARDRRGALLIARGSTVTDELLDRLRNLYPGGVCEPLRILEETP